MSKYYGGEVTLEGTGTVVILGEPFNPTYADMAYVLNKALDTHIILEFIPEWVPVIEFRGDRWARVLNAYIMDMCRYAHIKPENGFWTDKLDIYQTLFFWTALCWKRYWFAGLTPLMKPRTAKWITTRYSTPYCPWCEKIFDVDTLDGVETKLDSERANSYLVQLITHFQDWHLWDQIPELERIPEILHMYQLINRNRARSRFEY